MAQRRCVPRKIVESASFYDLSKASQALYLHLLADADDDGISEGKMIMRMGGFKGRDLQGLIDAGFVAEIEPSKRILYVVDFASFNTLKADRSTPSIYRQHLFDTFPALKNVVFTPKMNAFGVQKDSADKSKLDENKSEQSKLSQSKSDENKVETSDNKLEKKQDTSDSTTSTTITDPFFSDRLTEPTATDFDYHVLLNSDYEKVKPSCFPELITQYIKMRGWSEPDAQKIARRFVDINNDSGWKCLDRVPWTRQLEGFLRNEKTERTVRPEEIIDDASLDALCHGYESEHGKLDGLRREMVRWINSQNGGKYPIYINRMARMFCITPENPLWRGEYVIGLRNHHDDSIGDVDYYSTGITKQKTAKHPDPEPPARSIDDDELEEPPF